MITKIVRPGVVYTAVAVLGLSTPGARAIGSGVFTDIADSTEIAPGQTTAFSSFRAPAISAGNLAFEADYNAGNGNGVYAVAAGASAVTRVADSSQPAPGSTGTFRYFEDPVISGGNLAFYATTGASDGIYTATAGTVVVTRLADTNQNAPGQSVNFTNFGYIPAISGGTVAFQGIFSNSAASNNGLYTGTVGVSGSTRLADPATTAPGQTNKFSNFGAPPAISGNTVAFNGTYTTASGYGIYTATAGGTAINRVTDTTQTAPGQSVTFTAFNAPPVLSGGNLAFNGTYPGGGNGNGVYSVAAGTGVVTRLADTSQTALGQTANFNAFDPPAISGGQIAFTAFYSAGSADGIYLGTAGVAGVTRIADTSQTPPGLTTPFSSLGDPVISGHTVVFVGDFNNDRSSGIFLSINGTLTDLINTGDPLFGSTVTAINFGTNALDGNQLVYTYSLANGVSGVGEYAIIAVPEPSASVLLGLGAVGLVRLTLRRRRASKG